MSEKQYKQLNSRNPAWDFDKSPILEGEYLKKKVITMLEEGKEKSFNVYTFQVNEEKVDVAAPAMLDSILEDLEYGIELKIVFKGLGTPKKKKGFSAPRLFDVFVAE